MYKQEGAQGGKLFPLTQAKHTLTILFELVRELERMTDDPFQMDFYREYS